MAYFPNGMSMEWYEETYCNHCVHSQTPPTEDDETYMCPVMYAHWMHQQSFVNTPPGESPLDLLIPHADDPQDLLLQRCLMFIAKDRVLVIPEGSN